MEMVHVNGFQPNYLYSQLPMLVVSYMCLRIWFLFSILSRIVRVTDEVVEYRAWIQENFPVKVDDNEMIMNLPRTYASVATSNPLTDKSK